ncbi:unnamed protein product [Timema podura]|uniref:Uncharacterized protein n=1 Tax=Timema podura TaxID=61482 RepID=A0ABN7NVH6_TIMPD|nr:unnamed protein product [Timema podura]
MGDIPLPTGAVMPAVGFGTWQIVSNSTRKCGHISSKFYLPPLYPIEVKEGFGNQINLCRGRGLDPGPPAQKFDTLPLDRQVTQPQILR